MVNILPTGSGGLVTTLMWLCGVLAVLGIIGYILYINKEKIKYRLGRGGWVIDAEIIDTSGSGPLFSEDVARILWYDKEEGTNQRNLEFLYRNDTAQAIDRDYIYSQKNGRRKVVLKSPKQGEYAPMEIDTEDNKLETQDWNIAQWAINEVNRQIHAFNNDDEKWYQSKMAIWLGAGMFLLLSLIGAAYYQGTVAEGFNKAAQQLASAAGNG